jgi:hypothetical protein
MDLLLILTNLQFQADQLINKAAEIIVFYLDYFPVFL